MTIRRNLHNKIRKGRLLHSVKLTNERNTSFYTFTEQNDDKKTSFTRQDSKHDVFYTSKDDIRAFIDNKKASFKQSVLHHLYSKNDENKICFTQQNDKTTRFTHIQDDKRVF